jgi:glutamyl-tRNA(Gln) amidotransferase subunit D
MYSEKIEKMLKKANVENGDQIKVDAEGGEFSGLLMPTQENEKSETLLIKLNSGYNISLEPNSVELISKGEKRKTREEKGEKSKPGDIVILGCGGTIASKIEYKTGAVYPSISPKELKMAFPELEKYQVHSKSVFSLFSEDFNSEHWKIIAKEIESEIKNGSTGIVIMHGTDSMTYTSSAVSYMLQNLPVPVVFVGSQRSSDRPSSENEMNLTNAVFSATKNFGEVGVCMHATTNDNYCYIHRGTRVRKMHTSKREAFKSINEMPMFKTDYLKNEFVQINPKVKPRSEIKEFKVVGDFNPNVAMLYAHPNLSPKLLSKMSDYDGIVIVGMGLGHVSTNPFNDPKVQGLGKEIKELIQSGVSVVMSPQAIYGRICMRVYTTGRMLIDEGVIGDGADWSPEAAYTKLCWVLSQTKEPKKVEKMMMENIAGEISEISAVELQEE